MIVCDMCMDEDIMLINETTEERHLCTRCTLEAHIRGELTVGDYESLRMFPYELREENFIEDFKDQTSGMFKEGEIDKLIKICEDELNERKNNL